MFQEKLMTALWSLAVLVVFLLVWEYLPGWLGVPQFVLPPLSQVLVEAQRIWGGENLLWHAGITAFEVVVGFVLGSLLGAMIGYGIMVPLLGLSLAQVLPGLMLFALFSKMVRMILLVKQARRELVRIIHPRVVNPVTLGGAVVPMSVMTAVLGFMLIYGAATMGLSMLLLFSGLDIVTAFTAVVATVNNIGPGLGEVGPSGNFGSLSAFQTWVLSFAMLLGRLELLSVLVLFTGHFWRK